MCASYIFRTKFYKEWIYMVGVNLSLDIARNYCSYCSNVAVTAVETAFAKNVFKSEIN